MELHVSVLRRIVVILCGLAMPACNKPIQQEKNEPPQKPKQAQMIMKPAEVESSQPPRKPVLTKAEQERYDRVARKLVEAINKHDQKGYRALHTDEAWKNAIDWWRDMFAMQVLRFGSISRAYSPQRGIIRIGKMGMGGDERDGASFVVLFEKKAGGLFSIELNSEEKITHTSVFIKEELAEYTGWGAKIIYQKEK